MDLTDAAFSGECYPRNAYRFRVRFRKKTPVNGPHTFNPNGPGKGVSKKGAALAALAPPRARGEKCSLYTNKE